MTHHVMANELQTCGRCTGHREYVTHVTLFKKCGHKDRVGDCHMPSRARKRARSEDSSHGLDTLTSSSESSKSCRRSRRFQSRDASSESPLTSLSPAPPPETPKLSKIVIRGHELKHTVVFDTLWRWLAERKAMDDRRRQGVPAPNMSLTCFGLSWTADPILREFKFCQAYRVLDRTSQYVISQVIQRGSQSRDELLFRILLFNCFNKIETWELLEEAFGKLTYKNFELATYDKVLSAATARRETLFTNAYMKIGHKLDYDANHMRHLQLLQILMRDLPSVLANANYAADVFEQIAAYPGMGDFTAYQLMISLSYSRLLNFSGNDFVKTGPGASSGLAKMFGANAIKKAKITVPNIEEDVLCWMVKTQRMHFARLGLSFAYLRGPDGAEVELELADMEHAVCEVDKYARRAHPGVKGTDDRTQMRARFSAAGALSATPTLPKAWADPARRVSRVRPRPIDVEKRYCILKVLAERPAKNTEHGETLEYQVSWLGYEKPTWEPRWLILEDAPDLVKEWKAKKTRR
ncbi:hypothetical protein GGX14DRAFT_540155 [Mycena pura]|uniref:Chromo domain-containing protein n=1 Tax=Mycena pura TaxID=153505 RepID=A0AAD6YLK0_9AGAR|nr:hypothetical protein GGX14DRAFT_540155 [Mycena pura]